MVFLTLTATQIILPHILLTQRSRGDKNVITKCQRK